jgi:hypothetical protein
VGSNKKKGDAPGGSWRRKKFFLKVAAELENTLSDRDEKRYEPYDFESVQRLRAIALRNFFCNRNFGRERFFMLFTFYPVLDWLSP